MKNLKLNKTTQLMKKTSCFALMLVLTALYSPAYALEWSNQNQYFEGLKALCGARFEGEMTFPEEGQDSFAGKLLVASFDQCEQDQLRVAFVVGEDRSRTWIFSRLEDGGLQLKHDHRHEDGTPDEINMYGGMANDSGTSLSQSFAADEHTAEIIPAASTNVWTVSLDLDRSQLTYHLERHAKPRFTAILKRVDSAETN